MTLIQPNFLTVKFFQEKSFIIKVLGTLNFFGVQIGLIRELSLRVKFWLISANYTMVLLEENGNKILNLVPLC